MSQTDVTNSFRKVKKMSNITQFVEKKKKSTVSPKKHNIRIKKLYELNQSICNNAPKTNGNIKKHKNNDIILISDDDGSSYDFATPCSKKKIASSKKLFDKKVKLNNSDSDFETTLQSKNKTVKETRVTKTTTTKKKSLRTSNTSEKKPAVRKLTSNTNLKKCSFKNQPENQKSIKNFFTVHPKNSISYFDTFQESYQTMDSRKLKVENYINSGIPREFLGTVDENVCIDNDLIKNNTKKLKIMLRKELFPVENLYSSVIKKETKSISPLSLLSTSKAVTDISEERIMILSDDSVNNDSIRKPVEQNKPKNSSAKKENKSINARMTRRAGKKKSIVCPSYKIIEGTTFAVDAFRFGDISGITHYFLTHFHGDHYIGLTKKFSKPIYMSEITARLVNSFINVDKKYINIMKLNETIIINSNGFFFEITAIDANHCPGAIMLLFKNTEFNKCCLHTGDFRASFNMESEPIFWNNKIESVYLDTTYLNKNYAFKDQTDSLDELEDIIEKFREKHIGKKILYICGSYVIGKEKVWKKIADIIRGFVYVDRNRKKALKAINNYDLLKILVDDPKNADIHVIPMNDISYLKLKEYFEEFEDNFDILLAIRPSGWERNSKPRLGGKINIVGIEYSEHSSYSELRRFVRFLQPKTIISTVPNGDYSKTPSIPVSWFDNRVKPKQYGLQKSITTFFKFTSKQTPDDSINVILDATLSSTDSLLNNVMNKKSIIH